MPKDTFYRLPDEKRERILNAAKNEFFRVPYGQASINQIIKNADIPRGSFYQYFEDKKDIFLYVLSEQHDTIVSAVFEKLSRVNGDIFRLVDFYIDKIAALYQKENCARFLDTFLNKETCCVIDGIIRGEGIYDCMEEKLENKLLEDTDFSLYDMENDEEKRYFLNIISAVLRDSMRKLVRIEVERDPLEICDQLKKRMLFLEKRFRKIS
ncbi:MAG: TetR/AcrR family transcriptional regulator [Eubacteriales bacterium]|nr:TetR/AcrR family transcriptional regulator [Eubacteriales bacterium]